MKSRTLRHLLLFSLSILISGVFSEISAQPRLRYKANRSIRKTAVVIHAAHKQLKINRHFTGNFARAVAHQRFAKKQYVRGNFRSAIHHSRRARLLALSVVRDNKGAVQKDWEFSQEENMAAKKDNPSDEKLDNELMQDDPKLTFSDEELMDKVLDDVDVEDIVNDK